MKPPVREIVDSLRDWVRSDAHLGLHAPGGDCVG